MEGTDKKKIRMLHFAPEPFFRDLFKKEFGVYVTADLKGKNVDQQEDMTAMSFDDNSFDLILASHVLEHIKDDRKALFEIKRVLKPGGIAIIPVPIFREKTIEYPGPDPAKEYHVRAPGNDYYERYKNFFITIKVYSSVDFDEKHGLYLHRIEDQQAGRAPCAPFLPLQRIREAVPVCYK